MTSGTGVAKTPSFSDVVGVRGHLPLTVQA